MGMKARRDIIGDTGPNHFSRWDPIWNLEERGEAQHVHMLISINAKTEDFIEERYLQMQQILSRGDREVPRGPAARASRSWRGIAVPAARCSITNRRRRSSTAGTRSISAIATASAEHSSATAARIRGW